jgi:uncharacterized protein YbjT (DUF2867 family)
MPRGRARTMANYWDNLIHFGMQPRRGADGRLAFVLPLGEAQLTGMAAADIGACAAALFAGSEAGIGRRVDIAGERLSGRQMADALACAPGEPVRHVAMDPADYARLAFPGAADLANMFIFKRALNGEYCATRNIAATRALHPGLMRVYDFLPRCAAQLPIEARVAA